MGDNSSGSGGSDESGKDKVEFKMWDEEAENNDEASKVGRNENARRSFD